MATKLNREIYICSAFFIAGLLVSIYFFANSPGVTIDDEIGHFLISQNAWNYPELLLDSWGRFLNTLIFFIPSYWGLSAARTMALALSAVSVIITLRIAQNAGIQSWFLIPLFLWFQPWFLDSAFEVLTEIPFTLFLLLGIFFWQRNHPGWSALAFGALPLLRHEGIALTGLFFLFMAVRKKWRAALLSMLPLIFYNILFFMILKHWPFSIYLQTTPTEVYGTGAWLHYLFRIGYYAGLPVCLLSLFGLKSLWKNKENFIYFTVFITYLLTHVIIFRFGLYASGGYSIFLLPLAPALAIAATAGFDSLNQIFSNRYAERNWRKASHFPQAQFVITLAMLIVIAYGFMFARPHPLGEEAKTMRDAAVWIRKNLPNAQKVISSHVYFFYFYTEQPWQPNESWDTPSPPDKLTPGSMVLWDRHYASQRGINLNFLRANPTEWELLKSFDNDTALLFLRR